MFSDLSELRTSIRFWKDILYQTLSEKQFFLILLTGGDYWFNFWTELNAANEEMRRKEEREKEIKKHKNTRKIVPINLNFEDWNCRIFYFQNFGNLIAPLDVIKNNFIRWIIWSVLRRVGLIAKAALKHLQGKSGE